MINMYCAGVSTGIAVFMASTGHPWLVLLNCFSAGVNVFYALRAKGTK